MNYSALIEGRRSVRAFLDKAVPEELILEILEYHDKSCKRLAPDIDTALLILDESSQSALEGTAGYKQFLIGAPHYLLLLSDRGPHMGLNAGYMMEELVLKLTELDIDSCWLTFTDSARIKTALGLTTPLEVAAIVAFGYGEKTQKKLRLNILNMSTVDVTVERQYFAPKKGIRELVSVDTWGNKEGLDEMLGFYDDMLWQAFYAVSLAPSYLNRQPYGFLVRDHEIIFVQISDPYTDGTDAGLDAGIALLHFAAVAAQLLGKGRWELDPEGVEGIPESGRALARYWM